MKVIDPEFCFLGAREFDYGVALGHCALAGFGRGPAYHLLAAAHQEDLDEPLLLGFAGVEIVRRLIGLAQVPAQAGLDRKRRLLEVARSFVLTPEVGVSCWP
jgi:5-methylthioribose kinase